ncbi:hypothetical protein AHF37_09177 [Paragonimus kellicotti]|nr:hypothetical protein AHF37_09177 [Paragonimus kellicotti]
MSKHRGFSRSNVLRLSNLLKYGNKVAGSSSRYTTNLRGKRKMVDACTQTDFDEWRLSQEHLVEESPVETVQQFMMDSVIREDSLCEVQLDADVSTDCEERFHDRTITQVARRIAIRANLSAVSDEYNARGTSSPSSRITQRLADPQGYSSPICSPIHRWWSIRVTSCSSPCLDTYNCSIHLSHLDSYAKQCFMLKRR